MSGRGRLPLYKPEHARRDRCARGATNPGPLEPALWMRQQNDGRKRRKGRKPRIVGKWGPFRRGREAAETGGNWRKPPCTNSARETVCSFAVSATRGTPPCDWHIASGNCGNSLQIPWQASRLRLSASAPNGGTSPVCLMRIQRFRTSLRPCRDRRIRRAPACPAGNSAGPSTSRW